MKNIPIADIERELEKFTCDLLRICRLTQEAINKTSCVLLCSDVFKMQEIIDHSKRIGALCVAFEEYLDDILTWYRPEGSVLKLISSSINVIIELKQIADLTVGIAESLLNFNADIPERYKINIAQCAKNYKNIVWDSTISFLRQDAELAKKTIVASLELKKICSRMQEGVIEANKTVESAKRDESIVLFIIQSVGDISDHAVAIARSVI